MVNKNQLAVRIKELRNRKGMSQEFLADKSGLSLRTIQRIENGESSPTGHSIQQLSYALNITPDEITDWAIKEDKRFLTFLNLSALTFLFFPLLGILVPFILWTSKRDKIKNINKLGMALINFEITWSILLFLIPGSLLIASKVGLIENITLSLFFIIIGILYIVNMCLILINTIRLNNEEEIIYLPQIRFLH